MVMESYGNQKESKIISEDIVIWLEKSRKSTEKLLWMEKGKGVRSQMPAIVTGEVLELSSESVAQVEVKYHTHESSHGQSFTPLPCSG